MQYVKPKDTLAVIASNIDMLKRRHGIGAVELAQRSKVSPSMLRKINKGENVSIETLEDIARVFRLDVRSLLKPHLEFELDTEVDVDRYISATAVTTPLGRQTIAQAIEVAEQLANYGPTFTKVSPS